jgi:hypothetical protein
MAGEAKGPCEHIDRPHKPLPRPLLQLRPLQYTTRRIPPQPVREVAAEADCHIYRPLASRDSAIPRMPRPFLAYLRQGHLPASSICETSAGSHGW